MSGPSLLRIIMPAKRKRGVDGKDDKEDSPGPMQQPVRKKKKPLQYDPVSVYIGNSLVLMTNSASVCQEERLDLIKKQHLIL